ncbi:MAG TPA: amino acid transporter, partial [Candidatus Dormibacteraeota bacterium]
MTDTAMTDSVLADPDAPHLKKGALSLVDTTIIAISSTAPAYSVATSLGILIVAVGLQMPAALWVGFIPVMGIAVAFYYLNREDPNCGASYTWVSKILSPDLGFLNGWVILVADAIFCAFAGPQAGAATLTLINNRQIYSFLGLNLQAADTTAATVVGLMWLVFVTFMVAVGIQVAAKLQWVLCGIEYIIVLALGFWGLKQTGGSSFGWDWLNPRDFGSVTVLASGVVISVFLYWGWDTAANLNE